MTETKGIDEIKELNALLASLAEANESLDVALDNELTEDEIEQFTDIDNDGFIGTRKKSILPIDDEIITLIKKARKTDLRIFKHLQKQPAEKKVDIHWLLVIMRKKLQLEAMIYHLTLARKRLIKSRQTLKKRPMHRKDVWQSYQQLKSSVKIVFHILLALRKFAAHEKRLEKLKTEI